MAFFLIGMSKSRHSGWPYHHLPKETNKTIVLELVAAERERGMRVGEKEIVYPQGGKPAGKKLAAKGTELQREQPLKCMETTPQ